MSLGETDCRQNQSERLLELKIQFTSKASGSAELMSPDGTRMGGLTMMRTSALLLKRRTSEASTQDATKCWRISPGETSRST